MTVVNEWYNALFEYFVDDFNRLLEDLAALRVVQGTSSDVADNHRIDIERRCIAILFHFFQTLQNAGMASSEMRIHAEGLSWETCRQGAPLPVDRPLASGPRWGPLRANLPGPRPTECICQGKGQSRGRIILNTE